MPAVKCKKCGTPISVAVNDYRKYLAGNKKAVPEKCPKCMYPKRFGKKEDTTGEKKDRMFGKGFEGTKDVKEGEVD